MSDPYAVSRYFQNKASQWIASDGSIETYVRRVGKNALAEEFRADGGFGEVCELLHEFGELQSRAHIVRSLEGLVGDQFGWPLVGEMDIVIGAVALACGFTTLGEKLVLAGVFSLVAAGFAAALLGYRKK